MKAKGLKALSVLEMARLLGICPNTLRNWCRAGWEKIIREWAESRWDTLRAEWAKAGIELPEKLPQRLIWRTRGQGGGHHGHYRFHPILPLLFGIRKGERAIRAKELRDLGLCSGHDLRRASEDHRQGRLTWLSTYLLPVPPHNIMIFSPVLCHLFQWPMPWEGEEETDWLTISQSDEWEWEDEAEGNAGH